MTAKRDMTDREFSAALKRHGFKWNFIFINCDRHPGHGCGVSLSGDGTIAKRRTLARAIEAFEKWDAEKQAREAKP